MKKHSFYSPMTKGVIIAIALVVGLVISRENFLFGTIGGLLTISLTFLKVNFSYNKNHQYKFGLALFGINVYGIFKNIRPKHFLIIEPIKTGGRIMLNMAMESTYTKTLVGLQLGDKDKRTKTLIVTGGLKEIRNYANEIAKTLHIPIKDTFRR